MLLNSNLYRTAADHGSFEFVKYVAVAAADPLQDVSGGDTATLDSLIYLCSRADRDPLLFFTGQVAQLQVRPLVGSLLGAPGQWFQLALHTTQMLAGWAIECTSLEPGALSDMSAKVQGA